LKHFTSPETGSGTNQRASQARKRISASWATLFDNLATISRFEDGLLPLALIFLRTLKWRQAVSKRA
jgi:hypothetical protein